MHLHRDRIGLHELGGYAFCALLLAALLWPREAMTQVVIQGSQPNSVNLEQARAQAATRRAEMAAAQAAQATPQPAASKPNPSSPQPADQKATANPTAEAKTETPASVQRPTTPPKEPDPSELEIELNDQNLVPVFNFQGQPWVSVLAWYAKLCNASFDWQELPSDYVNLFTLQPQPLDEVRNQLNRLLLARGYVILQRDRTVSVFKLENIDPALVEQVDEVGLYSRKPYDFVKVTFKLPKAMAIDKAKEDLKQVLSPKARVLPFVSTHQVLLLDAVSNLRTVSEMLNLERLNEEGKSPLRQFLLKHRRAEDVIDILYVTLGMDPKSKPSQQELQVRQQELQIMQQMAQRGTDVGKMLKPDGPPVFLTFNSQMNSIIANAPEQQMQMIEETIKWLDVPLGGGTAGVPATPASLSDRAMQTYKLNTLDPIKFKTTLDDIGDLSPFTVIHADMAGQAILVQGPPADQAKIAKLVSELDGELRQMKVIALRHHPAEGVAVSIRELIAGESTKNDSQQDPYYQYLMSMANRNNATKEDPHKGFYVAADVDNNRLLVKANRKELEQIYTLLRELGETPDDRVDGVAMRVVEGTDSDVLERLRQVWAQTGGNPLLINGEAKPPAAQEKLDDQKKATQPAKDKGVQALPAPGSPAIFARFASQANAMPDAANEEAANVSPVAPAAAETAAAADATSEDQAPDAKPENETHPSPGAAEAAAGGTPEKLPISLTFTDDGRLVIRSEDASAVARLESLISELSPPPQRFKRFPVLHVASWSILYRLEDIFAEELEGEGEMMRDYYGRWQQVGREKGTGLGKRRKLMITEDPPTNSILVSNATNAQLHEIGLLIAELDRPTPEAVNVRARVTATIKVEHSRASIIATALKEVYVDLLSSRDREFANGEEGRSTAEGLRRMTEIRFGDPTNGGSGKGPRLPLTFNGQLSVGADDVSNHLLISCDQDLFDGVVAMIRRLDQASAPAMSIEVFELPREIEAEKLQKAVSDSMGRPWLGGRPEDQAMRGGGGGPQPGAQNQRGNPPRRGNAGNRGRQGR